MLVEQVKKLTPTERFLYWIEERHQIFLRRQRGEAKPWTDDEIFQTVFFTNPYRENDKTTTWFRKNVREPLRNNPAVVFATICFRWFNLIETGERLITPPNLLLDWDKEEAIHCLQKADRVFTGAYIIAGGKGSKLEAVCNLIDEVWIVGRDYLPEFLNLGTKSMRRVCERLQVFQGIGGFMAYEITCDLRYTKFLENAPDRMTWCNPGPGSLRGIYRIHGREFPKGDNSTRLPVPKEWPLWTKELLTTVQTKLSSMPPFEMREIEHSLCEFDKYERILWGDGRSKRRFDGKTDASELREQQVKILKALASASRPLQRKHIAKLSGVDPTKIGDFAGPRPLEQAVHTKAKWQFPTLTDLRYVVAETHDVDGRDVMLYRITEEGRKQLRR